jgi:hypothetical protein
MKLPQREKKVSRRVVGSSFMPKCEDQELQVEMLLRQRDTLTIALGRRGCSASLGLSLAWGWVKG